MLGFILYLTGTEVIVDPCAILQVVRFFRYRCGAMDGF
jgi:hypothetical protein